MEVEIDIDLLADGKDFNIKITKAKFEELCSNVFSRCSAPLQEALTDSKFSKTDIDDIVLVGGSTRMPKIQDIVSKFFNNK